MIKFILTEDEKNKLKIYLAHKSHPWQIMKRLEVIRLLNHELSVKVVAKQLAIRENLVREYIKVFKVEGISGLINLDKPGKESLLTEEKIRSLEEYIKNCEHTKETCTGKKMALFLYTQYGITISTRWLLKRIAARKALMKAEPWR